MMSDLPLADEAKESSRPRQLPVTEVLPDAMRWWPDLPEVEEEDG